MLPLHTLGMHGYRFSCTRQWVEPCTAIYNITCFVYAPPRLPLPQLTCLSAMPHTCRFVATTLCLPALFTSLHRHYISTAVIVRRYLRALNVSFCMTCGWWLFAILPPPLTCLVVRSAFPPPKRCPHPWFLALPNLPPARIPRHTFDTQRSNVLVSTACQQ